MTGHGVCSRSSHSWAAGRTTLSANPWTQSRMSFWSWLSWSEKVVSVCCAVAAIDGTLPFRRDGCADRRLHRGRLRLGARMGYAHEEPGGDGRARQRDERADEERPVKAPGQGGRVDPARPGQRVGARRGDRGEHGEAERAAD